MKRKQIQNIAFIIAIIITTACSSEENTQQVKQNDKSVSKEMIFFSGETQIGTRTSIAHVLGDDGKVNWSATDKIWVKDDSNVYQQSGQASFPKPADRSYARFPFSTMNYSHSAHDVIYTNGASATEVIIQKQQTQSSPNNFDHAGESGDFGIATARGSSSGYHFSLDHKASYLCLLPRSTNAYIHRSKLMKIEIVSDDTIAGNYTIAADGSLTLASNPSKTITLTTSTGFDLDNTTTDINKNGAYVVIAPGKHAMRIRYWLKNPVDGTKDYFGVMQPVEGTVTKYITMNFEAGKIHEITSNLIIKNYDADNYYMWDAKKNFWWQHEWNAANPTDPNIWQPSTGGTSHPNYPKNKTSDPDRWYNDAGTSYSRYEAINSCSICPNANEAFWYVKKGNPHWDYELWTMMGHLYRGGVWFKKISKIASENGKSLPQLAEKDPDGTDHRGLSTDRFLSLNNLLPKVSEMADYFYLPAAGYYQSNGYFAIGNYDQGVYWLSTKAYHYPVYAYHLAIGPNSISVMIANDQVNVGFRVQAFE